MVLNIVKEHLKAMGKDVIDDLTKPEKLKESVAKTGLPLSDSEQIAVGTWLSNYIRGIAYPPLA